MSKEFVVVLSPSLCIPKPAAPAPRPTTQSKTAPAPARPTARRRVDDWALRREVNDRIHDIAAHFSVYDPVEQFQIFCECGGTSCDLTVAVTFAEYAAIRSSCVRPASSVIAFAHEAATDGRVLEQRPNFVVVGRRLETV